MRVEGILVLSRNGGAVRLQRNVVTPTPESGHPFVVRSPTLMLLSMSMVVLLMMMTTRHHPFCDIV